MTVAETATPGLSTRSTFDVLIRGATVVDGTGGPAREADIGIVGDRIEAVGSLGAASAERVLEARGLVAAPGFIDMHGHSDMALLVRGSADSKVSQGVTTELAGNCGMSAAPYFEGTSILGIEAPMAVEALGGQTWTGMGSYLDLLQSTRPAINLVPLVGHGTAMKVSRRDNGGDAGAAEVARQALAEGAFGVSFGLFFPPEREATKAQLAAVAEEVARAGGFITVHLRDEGAYTIGLDESIREVLDVCVAAGARLQLSHLKAIGPGGWARFDRAMDLILEARASGFPLTADNYPYTASEVHLVDALRLDGPGVRRTRTVDPAAVDHAIAQRGGVERLVVCHCDPNPALLGLNLAQAAEALGVSLYVAIVWLVVEANASVASYSLRDEDVDRVTGLPWVSVGTDGVAVPLDLWPKVHSLHPRNFGTFPRFLAVYVREKQVVDLPTGIRKLTGEAARQIGLRDRGLLKPGYFADVVLFDYERVQDRADFTNPAAFSTGIETVIVNGQLALHEGRLTDVRAGRALAR